MPVLLVIIAILLSVASVAVMFIYKKKSIHIVCELLIISIMSLFVLACDYVFLNMIGFALALISLVIIIFTDYKVVE